MSNEKEKKVDKDIAYHGPKMFIKPKLKAVGVVKDKLGKVKKADEPK